MTGLLICLEREFIYMFDGKIFSDRKKLVIRNQLFNKIVQVTKRNILTNSTNCAALPGG